jgi:hypothetical protein
LSQAGGIIVSDLFLNALAVLRAVDLLSSNTVVISILSGLSRIHFGEGVRAECDQDGGSKRLEAVHDYSLSINHNVKKVKALAL